MKVLETLQGFSGEVLLDEPMFKHTYYRIGGLAQALVIPKSTADLQVLARHVDFKSVPFFILGLGSNLLVSDAGYSGLVIKTSRLNLATEEVGANLLQVGASVTISSLLRRAATEGYGGFELLTGIPGSIGGAVSMNAGTHLGEVKDIVRSVQVFDLESAQTQALSQLAFEYRKNLFLKPSQIVTAAIFHYKKVPAPDLKKMIDEVLTRRKATQPLDAPSCGSVFKNPKSSGKQAWQVIDELGLRGHQIGHAQISEKHCNFIVNLGGARAVDVRALIDLVKVRARSEQGIEMEEEVKFLGF